MIERPVEPLRIGHRWWISPPGHPAPADSRLIPLYLLPGKAFGSGDHPTTQLCLRSLEHIVKAGTTFVDLGAGTGVLSLAAAKLGAERVLAVDIDAASVDEARENIRLNGLTGRVEAHLGSLPEALAWPRPEDRPTSVVANILSHTLESFLTNGLSELVSAEGWLLLSGILLRQTPMLYATMAAAGFTLRAREQQEDWVCLLATHA